MMETARRKFNLPRYTRGEELFNMITHIVGGGLGVVAMFICAVIAAYHGNIWGVVGGTIYGFSVILLFTMSAIYHGLKIGIPKRVFRILDHCTIYVLIAGTYTPIMLGAFREAYPFYAWLIFGVVWGVAALGITLNAINLKKFAAFSVICYLVMGWIVVFRVNLVIEVLGWEFMSLLLLGGILYTVGVLFYVIGRKKKWMHSIFHIFVNVASILHSIAIAVYIMPA